MCTFVRNTYIPLDIKIKLTAGSMTGKINLKLWGEKKTTAYEQNYHSENVYSYICMYSISALGPE